MTNPETPFVPPTPDIDPNALPQTEEEPVAENETSIDYRIDKTVPLPTTEAGANFEQMERMPSPRTEAARSLTRLIGGVLGENTNTEAINSRYHSDRLTLELLKNDQPSTGEERDLFFQQMNPALSKLEKMGLGEYIAGSYLGNLYAYSMPEGQGRPAFKSLYSPWSYVNGQLKLNVDINKLRKSVEAMPEKSDQAKERKAQVLLELDTYEAFIENEVMNPTLEEDRYEEPSPEHLASLKETIDQVSEEMIALVGELPDAVSANASEERKKINKISGRIAIIIKYLEEDTKVALDKDKTKYPEFWQAKDKHKRIKQAVGSINLTKNTINRNIS